MVYVDGKPIGARDSLEESKQLAEEHKTNRLPLSIESMVAPAPSRTWNYDYDIGQWVEQL